MSVFEQAMRAMGSATGIQDMRKFRPLYEFTDPETGRSAVVHEGRAMPAQWHDYISASSSVGRELVRLAGELRKAKGLTQSSS